MTALHTRWILWRFARFIKGKSRPQPWDKVIRIEPTQIIDRDRIQNHTNVKVIFILERYKGTKTEVQEISKDIGFQKIQLTEIEVP